MNSWGNEQFLIQNMMPHMMQNAMPNPMMQSTTHMNIPPEFPVPEALNPTPAPMIGPILVEGHKINEDNIETVEMQISGNENNKSNQSKVNRNGRDRNEGRRDRERERGGDKRRRSRSTDRNRFDRHERPDRPERLDRPERNDRNRNDRRDRRSKWDSHDANNSGSQQMPMGNNMMMPGAMVPYGNMMANMMGQQQMEMSNMGHMANMPNVPNMQAMPNIGNMQNMSNMMPGMQMLPNMMDQNMMMMNHQGQMPMMGNQQIYFSKGVLLPPVPGVTTPSRRERPPGCRTIFVGGLSNGITEDVINEIFQRFGNIDSVKLHRQGVCHVRFERHESVDMSFALSGYRFKYHDQMENEATTLFIDFALNRDDQSENEKSRRRDPTPPRVENFTSAALNTIADKIKSDNEFAEAAPTLAFWLEHGECNKKNANTFYSLIQATNNQIRRLFNEKMVIDDEFQTIKTTLKDKFQHIIFQFEQVAKILTAAKHQRASDHFSKQQRRNIEMWLKMTEEVDNLKEEFNSVFDEEECEKEKVGKNMVPLDKYEELKSEHENLTYELEGYKNEAYLAKDEAERKFEKFKAHFVAQQALQNNKQSYPPLPPPPMPSNMMVDPPLPAVAAATKPKPPPPTPDDNKIITAGLAVPPSEAKLISILTAFLMVHPLGASVDYLVSYVRSMVPQVTQATVQHVLQKYNDVFQCKTSGVGASIEHRWCFATFDVIKAEAE